MSYLANATSPHVRAYVTPLALKNVRAGEESVAMTVEELLMKCQQTVDNLDKMLRSKLGDQQARNEKLKELSGLSQEISGLGPAPNPEQNAQGYIDWNTKKTAIEGKLEALRGTVSDSAIDGAKAGLNGSAEGNKAANTVLDQEMDTIRTENETSMIEIQSIISKRAQALQMTSNMVNSFNESSKALIQNIR